MVYNSSERLDYWSCFFLNSNTHTFTSLEDENSTFIYTCKVYGQYFTGRNYNGRVMCSVLAVLIFVLSVVGVLTNLLNILLLRKSITKTLSFRESLIFLAVIELVLCFFVAGNAVSLIFVSG